LVEKRVDLLLVILYIDGWPRLTDKILVIEIHLVSKHPNIFVCVKVLLEFKNCLITKLFYRQKSLVVFYLFNFVQYSLKLVATSIDFLNNLPWVRLDVIFLRFNMCIQFINVFLYLWYHFFNLLLSSSLEHFCIHLRLLNFSSQSVQNGLQLINLSLLLRNSHHFSICRSVALHYYPNAV